MKKVISVLISLMLLISAFSLFGCSPFEEDGEKSDKFNISISCLAEGGEMAVLKALEEEYEKKNPNVNIICKDYGGDSFTAYMTRYANNQSNLSTIMWMPDDEFAGFAEGGYFMDLRQYYEASQDTNYNLFYDSMIHSASYNGEYKPYSENSDRGYGVYYAPRDFNKIAIVYNKQLFSDFGIDVPNTSSGWDLDALINLSKTIANKIETMGREYSGYRALHLNLNWEPVYTTIFKALGSDGIISGNLLSIDSVKNKEIQNKLYEDLFYSDLTIDRSGSFTQGTTFMSVISRPTAVGLSHILQDEKRNTLIDFLPFPTEYVGAGNSGYGITAKSKNITQTVNGVSKNEADLAWDFIKFIITEEGQQIAGKTGLSVPVLKSLAANGEWRKAINKDLNHDAFLAGEELRLTNYNVFAPNKRTALRAIVSNHFSKLQSRIEGASDRRDTLINDTISAFNTSK